MKMLLKRRYSQSGATLGELFLNGGHECWTLEDVVSPSGVKVPGKTAIPVGRYRVIIDMSVRFKRPMPHVLNVPNFEGIRIHAGNTSEDTEGCILVGQTIVDSNFIGRSRAAFAALFEKLSEAQETGEDTWLTMEDAS